VASAYGQVSAAMGQNSLATVPTSADERKQRLEAFDKLKSDGIDWQPEESRANYRMAQDLRPDPITAGTAENIVFAVTKGLTKAIGAGMITGPVAGAGVFGASEGLQTAEDLAAQGVDLATRTKAGAVSGVMNAAGMALPVAGKTLAGTAALVAVGGPAQFIAQQAATRHILQSADYGRLAMQFDPLDPVGLAVATLLPAGFATWAKAGAISAAMKGKPKVMSDPAKVVTAEDSSVVAPVKMAATQDQVDAAMVHNLTIARDAHEAVPIEAVQAALEPAPRVGASDTAAKSLPPDVERAALKKAGDVQNENDAFDIAEEIRSLEEGGGVDLSKLFENPKFWDSENEQWTPEGQAAADGVTRKQAIENLRLRDITELSDLNLAHHKAQYAAMLEILDGLRIPYTDTSSAQSKYIEVGGRKLRFADHANQVRDSAVRGSLPVLNVAPGEATFADALRVVMEITPTANKSLLSQGLPRDGMQERAALAPVKVGAGDTAMIDRSPAADPWNEPRTLEQRIADESIRTELLRMKNETGWAEEGGKLLRSDGEEGDVIGRTAWVPNAEWWPGRPKGLKEFEVKAAIDKAIAGEKLKAGERRTVEYLADVAEQRRKSEAWKPTSDDLAEYGLASHNELDVAMTARAAEINPDAVEALATRFEADDAGFMRGIKELLDEHDRQTSASRQEGQRAPDATAGQPDPGAGQQAEAVTPPKAGDPHIASTLSRIEALKAQSPDLPVALREDGTPVTLAEELDAIRRQAREGTADTFGADDAPLIQVAVECMLSMGAA
jgi:hypothetical protein